MDTAPANGLAAETDASFQVPIAGTATPAPAWSYADAFARNLGLINPVEQEQAFGKAMSLLSGWVAWVGVDLVTLARLGIGRFTIADPDHFELANTNRQYGATRSTLGRSKAEVMAAIVRDINPLVELRVFDESIGAHNVGAFLEDADVLVDGIDAFEIDVGRILFREAAERGFYGLGAGPVGFSTVWVIIDPERMSFDRYFDLSDGMDPIDKFVAYVVGMAPRATQRTYMDLSHLDFGARSGPSASLACQLAGGVIGAEVLKILLRRGPLYPAPFYHQFDAYLGRFVRSRLIGGNRHPLQRLKRWWLSRLLRRRQIQA